MTLREEIYHDIQDVPENTLQMLHQFVRFLKENPADVSDSSNKKKRDRPRLLGVLEGQVWISDDFNDPMDFVSEEEQKVLETMRSAKKAKLQEHELHEAAI